MVRIAAGSPAFSPARDHPQPEFDQAALWAWNPSRRAVTGLCSLKITAPDNLVYPIPPLGGEGSNPVCEGQSPLHSAGISLCLAKSLLASRPPRALFLPDLISYFPLAISFQHWPPGIPPPQVFCICSFLSLECSSPDIQVADSLHFKSLLKYQLLDVTSLSNIAVLTF